MVADHPRVEPEGGVVWGEDRRQLMRKRLAAILLIVTLAGVSDAAAEVYPSHPITMVVPFAAGGPVDTLARILSERMTQSLGQPIIIDNVTGAAGTIGVGRVARAAADGYMLSIGHRSTHVVNGAIYALQYDLLRDFDPVVLLPSNPMMVVAKNAVPAKGLGGLVAWIKANESKVSAGTAGSGSGTHVAGVYFQNVTGTRFQFVPYRGSGPALQDLVAGQIDLMVDQASNSMPQVREGKIRAY